MNTAPPSFIDYLKTVDTPTLSNAIEKFQVRPRREGFASCEIRCLFPDFGRMCGWAVTAHVETITKSYPDDAETFPALFRAVLASQKPAVVAFQEVGAHRELSAHCGEVMGTVFQRLGAVGLVTDGAVRDIPEVRALRFHYFARGAVASHANFRVVRVGVPIQVTGMTIQSGDLVHGDENGIIQVPLEVLDRLPAAVEAVRASEKPLLEFARGPEFDLDELVKRFFH